MIALEVLERYRQLVGALGLGTFELDDRPWGGEFIYDESSLEPFVKAFFADVPLATDGGAMKPKLLFIAPGQRFSWQYHERRGEAWKVLEGPVGLIHAMTDEQGSVQTLQKGDMVVMQPRERHRLVGQTGWGVVAELWQHADPTNPSNEADNIRLADDYNRS